MEAWKTQQLVCLTSDSQAMHGHRLVSCSQAFIGLPKSKIWAKTGLLWIIDNISGSNSSRLDLWIENYLRMLQADSRGKNICPSIVSNMLREIWMLRDTVWILLFSFVCWTISATTFSLKHQYWYHYRTHSQWCEKQVVLVSSSPRMHRPTDQTPPHLVNLPKPKSQMNPPPVLAMDKHFNCHTPSRVWA